MTRPTVIDLAVRAEIELLAGAPVRLAADMGIIDRCPRG